METHRFHAFLSVLIIFFSSFILLSHSLAPPGTIQRTTKQQLLASLPPSEHDTASSQLFLTSPSAKYAVYLLRRETSLGAGGFGNDFCYLQVQDSAAGGVSVWESDCTSVSNVNTCTLLFSEAGLEIFDGSQSAWDNDVDGENLETLVLMDSGDMQIRDKEGDVVWKASDNPVVNQNCGSIGAPGLAPDHPTFGSPIHDDSGPFGQPAVDSPVVQQPHPDQLGASVQPPHQLGASSPAHEEENQPQHVPTASPEEQVPAASPEEENQPQHVPAASPEEQVPAASPEEENQPQHVPAASPEEHVPAVSLEEENNQLQHVPAASPEEQVPAASPEEENNQLQQEPGASPEEENQTQQEPTASPEEEQQPQQEPAASPDADHHRHHQQQPGSLEEGLNNPSSSLGHDHPIGARNQPSSYLNQQQQQQSFPVGVAAHQQPLIDNTPFDSGSSREKPSKLGVTLVFLFTTLMAYNFFLLG